jgi:hypothetical protein
MLDKNIRRGLFFIRYPAEPPAFGRFERSMLTLKPDKCQMYPAIPSFRLAPGLLISGASFSRNPFSSVIPAIS